MIERANIEILKRRADFVKMRNASFFIRRPAFFLQAEKNNLDIIRVGFTASKKIGNAVARNRAKRRLRALAFLTLPLYSERGYDYVWIARNGATERRDFAKMQKEAEFALKEIHQ